MTLDKFFRELSAVCGVGGAERRFARDLARTLGFKSHEPEHGKPTNTPAAKPSPAPAEAKPYSTSFEAGVEHGRTWGFNRAYRSDLQRLAEWVGDVGGDFSKEDVVAVVFPNPVGEWMKHDADRLLAGNEDYARGFVVGGMLVWAHQLTKEASTKEN